jgi:hypothetical protein
VTAAGAGAEVLEDIFLKVYVAIYAPLKSRSCSVRKSLFCIWCLHFHALAGPRACVEVGLILIFELP